METETAVCNVRKILLIKIKYGCSHFIGDKYRRQYNTNVNKLNKHKLKYKTSYTIETIQNNDEGIIVYMT